MDNRITLHVWDTISAAWNKVYGAKGSLWAAFVIMLIIMFIFGILRGVADFLPAGIVAATLIAATGIIGQIIQILLQYGLYYMGIRRANDESISYDMMFRTFEKGTALRSIGLAILLFLFVILPAGILFFLPLTFPQNTSFHLLAGIMYIIGGLWVLIAMVRVCLALGYLLDMNMGPVDALKRSWHATKGNFFPLLGIFLLGLIITIVSMIPLGIGLIWTIPWGFVLYGVIYQRLKLNA